MKTKKAISLIEIMIVIFLISLIGAAIGYNMKGSLDKGKEFKTVQSMQQIQDILLLQVANGENIDKVVKDPERFLVKSGLVKDVDKLLIDGWGERFEITKKDDEIVVSSKTLNKMEELKAKKEKKLKKAKNDNDFEL